MTNVLAVRSEIVSSGQENRSFIETARRAQIVECAIEVIAEVGYANASLAEIAKRAGVSKGVISYHFVSKAELIQEVANSLQEKGGAAMRRQVLAEHSAASMLRVYIQSNLEFLGSHRKHVVAVMNIAVAARDGNGKPMIDLSKIFDRAERELENLLRYGRKRGEFREFSTKVMATTIRNAIDGLAQRLAVDPNLDLNAYASELTTLFDLATREPSPQRR